MPPTNIVSRSICGADDSDQGTGDQDNTVGPSFTSSRLSAKISAVRNQ